ncbi:hypothetical protein [Burkholderia sp. Ac-20344]|uniref:alpha/beta fold hydrolase n=1 Tax=Burkholderia sp. Ac-20344 TaxID=2703890 RepID=UPI00197C3C46|nr:hypothetical protein [Burkholderia sp. Ac-20344]MBN3830335.1 hypothetical protein [Burkholderia sp. Ac-20344]
MNNLFDSTDVDAHQVNDMVASGALALPILAIAGGVVGAALAGQLRGVSTNLTESVIADCAHLIPLEQPAALVAQIRTFLV